jgi:hypothetical protein
MFGWDTHMESGATAGATLSASQEAAAAFSGHGLIAGTKVASALGWRSVEAIGAGDKVLTFDNGMQTVTNVRRTTFRVNDSEANANALPVVVPVGALGNRVPLTLLPEQGVMVESDAASDANGDPFAIVPAAALSGYRNIAPTYQARDFEVVTLYFETPQVVYAEAGTLIYCPAAPVDLLNMIGTEAEFYDVLSTQDAAMLVECMQYEDLTAAYRPAGYSPAAYAA